MDQDFLDRQYLDVCNISKYIDAVSITDEALQKESNRRSRSIEEFIAREAARARQEAEAREREIEEDIAREAAIARESAAAREAAIEREAATARESALAREAPTAREAATARDDAKVEGTASIEASYPEPPVARAVKTASTREQEIKGVFRGGEVLVEFPPPSIKKYMGTPEFEEKKVGKG